MLLAALAVGHSAYVCSQVLSAAPEYRIQFIPDDAFYYLVLAKNFVLQRQWTFDSGVSLTTGFHPLWAYVLTALYAATHAAGERFVTLSSSLSFGLALPAALAAAFYAVRIKNPFPVLLLLLFSLSRNVSLNLVSAVEWSLVVVLAAAYCIGFGASANRLKKSNLAGILLCGFLGSLARTDFGLLAAALVAAALFGAGTAAGRQRLFRAALGLGGAVAGVAAGWLRNYASTGQLLQSSAMMKGFWARTLGASGNPIYITTEILSLFGEAPRLKVLLAATAILALAAIGLGIWVFRPTREPHPCHGADGDSGNARILWVGALFAIVGYVVLYSFGWAVQNWYTANLIVPVFLALSLPIGCARRHQPVAVFANGFLVLLVCAQAYGGARLFSMPEWPWQATMYRAGHSIGDAAPDGRIGSWNAGIIGYYSGGRVVNLDGLVNNDIYEHAVLNTLPEYIAARQIAYLLDSEILMFPPYRKRGGYDRPDFLRRLAVVKQFEPASARYGKLTLFRVLATEADEPVTVALRRLAAPPE